MNRRAVRVCVVLVFAGIAATAAYQAIARSRALEAAAARRSSLAQSVARADLALAELAASQRGYVAPGQDFDFWTVKVDEALAAARSEMTRLGSSADAAIRAQAAVVLTRLDDLAAVDNRVRAYARNGQRAVASDVIFADGYETLASARAELAAAASLGQAAAGEPMTRDRQVQLASFAVLAAIAVGALLLLLRAPKQPEPRVTSISATEVAPVPAAPVEAPADLRVIDDSVGAALDASLEGLDDLTPAVPAPIAHRAAAPAPLDRSKPSVTAVADLCVDLARLLDARDLGAVLARAASALGAGGLVVWIADETSRSMAPALAHGYSPAVITRIGALSIDADNPTAAAWRTTDAQVVDGALALPLMTSLGCTGVLAIEFRDGREHDADTLALARIIAAQLAATISPAASESRQAAGG